MARLIDADVLIDTLDEWEENAVFGTENDGTDGTTMILSPVPTTTREMQDLIGMQPTVDAAYAKHGKWTDVLETTLYVPDMRCTFTHTAETCSRCKVRTGFVGPKRYLLDMHCPNCSAKMDGGAADA